MWVSELCIGLSVCVDNWPIVFFNRRRVNFSLFCSVHTNVCSRARVLIFLGSGDRAGSETVLRAMLLLILNLRGPKPWRPLPTNLLAADIRDTTVKACIKVLFEHTCMYRVCLLILNWVFQSFAFFGSPAYCVSSYSLYFLCCFPVELVVCFLASAHKSL